VKKEEKKMEQSHCFSRFKTIIGFIVTNLSMKLCDGSKSESDLNSSDIGDARDVILGVFKCQIQFEIVPLIRDENFTKESVVIQCDDVKNKKSEAICCNENLVCQLHVKLQCDVKTL
jgi:hypothetical protein